MNELAKQKLLKRKIKVYLRDLLLNKTAAADRVELFEVYSPQEEEDFPAIRLYALGEMSTFSMFPLNVMSEHLT